MTPEEEVAALAVQVENSVETIDALTRIVSQLNSERVGLMQQNARLSAKLRTTEQALAGRVTALEVELEKRTADS